MGILHSFYDGCKTLRCCIPYMLSVRRKYTVYPGAYITMIRFMITKYIIIFTTYADQQEMQFKLRLMPDP